MILRIKVFGVAKYLHFSIFNECNLLILKFLLEFKSFCSFVTTGLTVNDAVFSALYHDIQRNINMPYSIRNRGF